MELRSYRESDREGLVDLRREVDANVRVHKVCVELFSARIEGDSAINDL